MSDVRIVGVGMHPWGKWGRNFAEYGVVAARAALADAGLALSDVQYLAAGNTMRNGYPGYVAGSTLAQALGWSGLPVSSSYAACASGAVALDAARARIRAGLADVALVVGADTAPKGFFGPLPGDRPEDPDWLRFHVLGATNPTYFALYARRRMECYGATPKDFAAVKVKNSRHGLANPNARYRKLFTEDEIADSPVVADPLRLVDICATSDGAAAVVLTSADYAAAHADRAPSVDVAAVSTVTPTYPNTSLDLPDIATDSAVGAPPPPRSFRDSIAHAAYEEAGLGADRPQLRRGLRPLHRARARLVREHRALRAGRGRGAAALRRDHPRRARPGQPQRRAGLLRRGHPRPGPRPDLRADLAAARRSRRTPGRARPRRPGRQPGSLRARLLRDPHVLTDARPTRAGPAAWEPYASGAERVDQGPARARRTPAGTSRGRSPTPPPPTGTPRGRRTGGPGRDSSRRCR